MAETNVSTIVAIGISCIEAQVLLLVDNFAIFVQVPQLVRMFITMGNDDRVTTVAGVIWNIKAQVLFFVHDST